MYQAKFRPMLACAPDHFKSSQSTLTTVRDKMGTHAELSNKAAGMGHRFEKWMINEGSRQLFLLLFVALHGLAFAFGMVHYSLHDSLIAARRLFGITSVFPKRTLVRKTLTQNSLPVARATALVLHLDTTFILLPMCRNLISALRSTSVGSIIPFDDVSEASRVASYRMLTECRLAEH